MFTSSSIVGISIVQIEAEANRRTIIFSGAVQGLLKGGVSEVNEFASEWIMRINDA